MCLLSVQDSSGQPVLPPISSPYSAARSRVSLQRRRWISQSMMEFSAPASLSGRVGSAAVRRSMETRNGRADDWLHAESSQSLVPSVPAALPVLAASLLLPSSAGPSPAASTAQKGITSTKRGQLCSLAQNPCFHACTTRPAPSALPYYLILQFQIELVPETRSRAVPRRCHHDQSLSSRLPVHTATTCWDTLTAPSAFSNLPPSVPGSFHASGQGKSSDCCSYALPASDTYHNLPRVRQYCQNHTSLASRALPG